MQSERHLKLKSNFIELASKGLNCKQIAEIMKICPKQFGAMFKTILGIYPSIYIARMNDDRG